MDKMEMFKESLESIVNRGLSTVRNKVLPYLLSLTIAAIPVLAQTLENRVEKENKNAQEYSLTLNKSSGKNSIKSEVNSNSIVKDGIEYYMQTDKKEYSLVEKVQMLYRVTNFRDENVNFGFPTNKQHHFRVSLSDGTHIWQMDTAADDVGTSFTLQPDEFKEFNEIWGLVNDNGTRGWSDDYPVGVGNYHVIGELYLPYQDNQYVSVSVSINISAETYVNKAETYFPLHVGNSWTYVKSDDGSTKTFTIIGTEEVNGNIYYKFDDYFRRGCGLSLPEYESAKLRYDSQSDKVLQYWYSVYEDIRYDFSGTPWNGLGSILSETNISNKVPAGEFDNCIKFQHGIWAECGSYDEILAPGVGNIEYIGSVNTFKLQKYKIEGVTYIKNEQPTEFSLQNYPNPFNSSTLIKYQLPENTKVSLDIYNISGQKIKTLVDRIESKGLHQVKFDGNGLSSGVYFYTLRIKDRIKTNKMLLVK